MFFSKNYKFFHPFSFHPRNTKIKFPNNRSIPPRVKLSNTDLRRNSGARRPSIKRSETKLGTRRRSANNGGEEERIECLFFSKDATWNRSLVGGAAAFQPKKDRFA